MRIAVHDFAGHPFQVELTRELASRGNDATHFFFRGLATPQGDLTVRDDDPKGFDIVPVGLDEPFQKNAYVKRALQEREYGKRLAAAINDFAPDVLLTSNTPNDVLDALRKRVSHTVSKIWWVQDIYSLGIERVFAEKSKIAGRLLGGWYGLKERKFADECDHVVCISDDFQDALAEIGIDRKKCVTIENWATLSALTPHPKDNAWRREQGFGQETIVLYAGTLARKHNPAIISDTAAHFKAQGRDDVVFVVVSEGIGADFLAERKAEQQLDNLRLLPFQPFDRLAETLSSADVLTALIEPEAAQFSVPSKVLSYLCVGRPLLCAIPSENLATRTIARAGAGKVIDPSEAARFPALLKEMLAEDMEAYGTGARAYAERAFDIKAIGDQFEALLPKV